MGVVLLSAAIGLVLGRRAGLFGWVAGSGAIVAAALLALAGRHLDLPLWLGSLLLALLAYNAALAAALMLRDAARRPPVPLTRGPGSERRGRSQFR